MGRRVYRLIGFGFALPLMMVCSVPQGRRSQDRNPKQSVPDVLPLADLRGTLKGLDRKGLTIEVEDGNLLELQCSKKTQYFVKSEKARPSAFHPGDRISVETRRALTGVLEAVNVRLEERRQ